MRVLAVLVLAFVGFWGWQERRLRANEHRLAQVASEVSGRTVGISCPGFLTRLVEITPNAGWVEFDAAGRPSDHASLDSRTCARLERFDGRDTGGLADTESMEALVTLAHESFHLAGIASEAQTQCYAVQATELVARRLGASPTWARTAALWALASSPRILPREYWSPQCHDGGSWDLRPASSVWP